MIRTFIFSISLIFFSPLLYAGKFQDLQAVQNLFKTFLDTQLAKNVAVTDDVTISYQLSKLDNRLKLPACAQRPEVFVPKGPLKAGRNTLGIRCRANKGWTIYSSVTIKMIKPVLVMAQSLNRGEQLTKQHLRYQKMDIGLLRQGYLSNPEAILNKQAKRYLSAGTLVNPRFFEAPDLVKRGEIVKIQAKSPSFQISMAGIALMNGKEGQNIRVKNIASKRIIQARVAKPGLVTIF